MYGLRKLWYLSDVQMFIISSVLMTPELSMTSCTGHTLSVMIIGNTWTSSPQNVINDFTAIITSSSHIGSTNNFLAQRSANHIAV